MARGPLISFDDKRKIAEMYRAGEKIDYIGAVFEVSIAAVCRIAKAAGLERGRGQKRPTRSTVET